MHNVKVLILHYQKYFCEVGAKVILAKNTSKDIYKSRKTLSDEAKLSSQNINCF